MFDITTQAVVDTAILHLKDAEGELLYADAERTKPCQIEIWGPGTAAFGIVESRQSSRAIKRIQDNDGKMSLAPFEERRKESAEDLATLTRRFINFVYPPAGDAEGAELFAACYADPKLGFIVKQVQQGVNDWGKFKRGSAPN